MGFMIRVCNTVVECGLSWGIHPFGQRLVADLVFLVGWVCFVFFIIFLSFFLLVLIKSRIGYRYGETQPGSLDVDACTSDRDGCSATTEAFRHVEARAPQPPPPPRDRRYAWRPFAEPRAARRSAPRDSPTVAESGRAQRFRIT